MKPAVTKVVFIEDCARTLAEELIQGELLLGPIPRFLTLLPRKPLQDLRNHSINRPKRRKGIMCCEPVQVGVLPAKDCLQDLVYLIQSQGAPNLKLTPNRRLADDELHADHKDRVAPSASVAANFSMQFILSSSSPVLEASGAPVPLSTVADKVSISNGKMPVDGMNQAVRVRRLW